MSAATATRERTVLVLARVDPSTNETRIGDATLIFGDGTVRVSFLKGRAQVPESIAREFCAMRSDLDIPELGIHGRDPVATTGVRRAPTAATLMEEGAPEGISQEEFDAQLAQARAEARAELTEMQGALAEMRAELESVKKRDDAPARAAVASAGGSDSPGDEPASGGAQAEQLAAAREHLEAEGININPDDEGDHDGDEPDGNAPAARVVPPEFEDRTAEDEPRCLAKKGDGTQCANPAPDGGPSCHLAAHRKQFTS